MADGLGGFADDKFGFDRDLITKAFQAMEPIQDALRRNSSHIREGLTDCCKPGIAEGRQLDIVETNYGDISGNAEAQVFQCAHGTNGGHIIEGNQGGKPFTAGKQLADNRVA